MAVLTRADVMRALKIRKLLTHAADHAATGPEAEAYAAKARQLTAAYRYGNRMTLGDISGRGTR